MSVTPIFTLIGAFKNGLPPPRSRRSLFLKNRPFRTGAVRLQEICIQEKRSFRFGFLLSLSLSLYCPEADLVNGGKKQNVLSITTGHASIRRTRERVVTSADKKKNSPGSLFCVSARICSSGRGEGTIIVIRAC